KGPYSHILNQQLVTGINRLDAVAVDATLRHAECGSLRRNKGGRGVRLKGSQRGLMAMVSMIVSRDYRIDPGNFIGINRNRRRPVNTRVEGFSLRRGRTKVRVDIDRSLRGAVQKAGAAQRPKRHAALHLRRLKLLEETSGPQA